MHEDPRPRILCVDDEPNVLEGLARTLRALFAVETAVGGARGLEMLRERGPFVIVVSDLRIPRMTGIQFLASARELAPDTIRVLLTGQGRYGISHRRGERWKYIPVPYETLPYRNAGEVTHGLR